MTPVRYTMRALYSTSFVFYVIISTQLTSSVLIYKQESHDSIRRCDDGEQWRPLDIKNATNSKEQEESSDLVIGSDSHEDYTLQVEDNTDNRYQHNAETADYDNPQFKENVQLVSIDKIVQVPSNQKVLSPIPVPVPFEVKEPFQLNIPVPLKVENERLVPVERIVYHPVVRPVPMEVVKEVRVPIPQPYPVYYPVYKLKLVIHPPDAAPPRTNYHDY